jgi:LysR family transcriptional regulator for metE and metH
VRTAERILADLERAETVAARLGSNVREVVRIGMAAYRNFSWVPQFVTHLRKVAPHIAIELAVDADGAGIDALKAQVVDVFITPHEAPSQTTRIDLFPDEIVALVAPTHRLAARRTLVPAEVEAEVFYTYSLAVAPGFEYLKFLQPAHVDPVRYVMVASPETAAAAVRGGQGMTILSRWCVRSDLEDGRLTALTLGERGVKIRWGALVRAGDEKRSAAHEVAQQLRAFFSSARLKRAAN